MIINKQRKRQQINSIQNKTLSWLKGKGEQMTCLDTRAHTDEIQTNCATLFHNISEKRFVSCLPCTLPPDYHTDMTVRVTIC